MLAVSGGGEVARELPEALRFRCRKCDALWPRSELVRQSTHACPLCGGELDPADEDDDSRDDPERV